MRPRCVRSVAKHAGCILGLMPPPQHPLPRLQANNGLPTHHLAMFSPLPCLASGQGGLLQGVGRGGAHPRGRPARVHLCQQARQRRRRADAQALSSWPAGESVAERGLESGLACQQRQQAAGRQPRTASQCRGCVCAHVLAGALLPAWSLPLNMRGGTPHSLCCPFLHTPIFKFVQTVTTFMYGFRCGHPARTAPTAADISNG